MSAIHDDLQVASFLADLSLTMTRLLASGEALAGKELGLVRDQLVIAAEHVRGQELELQQSRPLIARIHAAMMDAGGKMQ